MITISTCVAVFDTWAGADKAVRALRQMSFDTGNISLAVRDSHAVERVLGHAKNGTRSHHWAMQGAIWEYDSEFISKTAFFLVPELGPILVSGPLVARIVAALEDAVVSSGLSILGAGLLRLGVPRHSIVDHEESLSTGKFLFIAAGTPGEMKTIRETVRVAQPATTRQHTYESNISDVESGKYWVTGRC